MPATPQPPAPPAPESEAPEPEAAEAAESPPPPPAPVEPVETQTAAAVPGVEVDGDMSIMFEGESAELSDEARGKLLTLAQDLLSDQSKRIQLLAFASDTDGSASRARRLSLSRALAVRAYLIEQGIESTRMDVRALGNRSTSGPPDRVDIELAAS